MKNGVEVASIMKGKEKGKIVRLIIGGNTDLKTENLYVIFIFFSGSNAKIK
ncbi:hypothetical protein [Bacillus nitratireducens]|uniref:hypothetical protein n=1 Tax=Bacillus nitratireducens TaxID=2026193 RepID=UPI0014835BE8|nr:hypothetical protein [Bacillus nitratireducens]MED0901807.1 hypothetical protein [Bacillus nitratireducens]